MEASIFKQTACFYRVLSFPCLSLSVLIVAYQGQVIWSSAVCRAVRGNWILGVFLGADLMATKNGVFTTQVTLVCLIVVTIIAAVSRRGGGFRR